MICDLFDQLFVDKRAVINFEACYRVGPFNKHRSRPILVSFEKQIDHDMIYARRLDLKSMADYQEVWLNKDLNPASKRKRGLIAKEAQGQGIYCKIGKYAIFINKTRYSNDNLEELPPRLQLANLKQVQIHKDTLAYQSEFAPLPNFYPCRIVIGKHVFLCAEQAFPFLKAKTLRKPLLAPKIYLPRDVRYIKQLGVEVGTSEEREAQQIDFMHICLKKKFDQNPDLKALNFLT